MAAASAANFLARRNCFTRLFVVASIVVVALFVVVVIVDVFVLVLVATAAAVVVLWGLTGHVTITHHPAGPHRCRCRCRSPSHSSRHPYDELFLNMF